MSKLSSDIVAVYVLQAFVKGLTVLYFVLLPVLYAQKFISSEELGYIGALLVAMVIVGAVVVARWLHAMSTKQLLTAAALCAVGASMVFFLAIQYSSKPLLIISYVAMGLVVGMGMSGVNVLAAGLTVPGQRFGVLAKLAMLTDVVRMVFPLLVVVALSMWDARAAIVLIFLTACVFLVCSLKVKNTDHVELSSLESFSTLRLLRGNKPFGYMLVLEFLDSFASSQLFVFFPVLLLARGITLENSLVLQTCIFLGYFSGRWFMGKFATRYSGLYAVAWAEVGMMLAIVLILIVHNVSVLYVLSFVLGVFARGTSPAIKALAFDALGAQHVKKGSALHIVAGDTGSAIGQLIFGLLVGWWGASSPFIVAIFVAGIIVLLCFVALRHSVLRVQSA